MTEAKDFIARRAARELYDGAVVILGIGIPVRCAKFLPEDVDIRIMSDAGIVGEGPIPRPEDADPWHIVDSAGKPAAMIQGGCITDQSTHFGLIRGGHVDLAVLGCLECDEQGSMASWVIPDKRLIGIGGSMDICTGAKRVIITTTHTNHGESKIRRRCSLPVTAPRCVDTIITEMGVMRVTPEGLVLGEINPEFTPEQVQEATDAELIISPRLKSML